MHVSSYLLDDLEPHLRKGFLVAPEWIALFALFFLFKYRISVWYSWAITSPMLAFVFIYCVNPVRYWPDALPCKLLAQIFHYFVPLDEMAYACAVNDAVRQYGMSGIWNYHLARYNDLSWPYRTLVGRPSDYSFTGYSAAHRRGATAACQVLGYLGYATEFEYSYLTYWRIVLFSGGSMTVITGTAAAFFLYKSRPQWAGHTRVVNANRPEIYTNQLRDAFKKYIKAETRKHDKNDTNGHNAMAALRREAEWFAIQTLAARGEGWRNIGGSRLRWANKKVKCGRGENAREIAVTDLQHLCSPVLDGGDIIREDKLHSQGGLQPFRNCGGLGQACPTRATLQSAIFTFVDFYLADAEIIEAIKGPTIIITHDWGNFGEVTEFQYPIELDGNGEPVPAGPNKPPEYVTEARCTKTNCGIEMTTNGGSTFKHGFRAFTDEGTIWGPNGGVTFSTISSDKYHKDTKLRLIYAYPSSGVYSSDDRTRLIATGSSNGKLLSPEGEKPRQAQDESWTYSIGQGPWGTLGKQVFTNCEAVRELSANIIAGTVASLQSATRTEGVWKQMLMSGLRHRLKQAAEPNGLAAVKHYAAIVAAECDRTVMAGTLIGLDQASMESCQRAGFRGAVSRFYARRISALLRWAPSAGQVLRWLVVGKYTSRLVPWTFAEVFIPEYTELVGDRTIGPLSFCPDAQVFKRLIRSFQSGPSRDAGTHDRERSAADAVPTEHPRSSGEETPVPNPPNEPTDACPTPVLPADNTSNSGDAVQRGEHVVSDTAPVSVPTQVSESEPVQPEDSQSAEPEEVDRQRPGSSDSSEPSTGGTDADCEITESCTIYDGSTIRVTGSGPVQLSEFNNCDSQGRQRVAEPSWRVEAHDPGNSTTRFNIAMDWYPYHGTAKQQPAMYTMSYDYRLPIADSSQLERIAHVVSTLQLYLNAHWIYNASRTPSRKRYNAITSRALSLLVHSQFPAAEFEVTPRPIQPIVNDDLGMRVLRTNDVAKGGTHFTINAGAIRYEISG